MAVDLTPLVAIIIAALAAAIIALILVVVCYCLSRKHLNDTRNWSRRQRAAGRSNQPVVTKTRIEQVSKQDQNVLGPRNVLGGRMYLPTAAPHLQPTDYNNDAGFIRPQSVAPRPVNRLQPIPVGFTRANFDVGGAYRGLQNTQLQQQRSGPTPVRSRSFEDLLDGLNDGDRQQRRRKNKHATRVKNGRSNGVDETSGATPIRALPPPGAALAYVPHLLPSVGPQQPALNVLPAPGQMAFHYPAAAAPQAATSSVQVGAAPPAAAPGELGQSSATRETTWTRAGDAGNGSFGSGNSGSSSGGNFSGQQAVFAPARSAAFQASGAQRRYEDQERVVSATDITRFR